MKLLRGGSLSNKILQNLQKQLNKTAVKPILAVILVGQNYASQIYVNLKEKACHQVGINFQKFYFPSSVKENKVIALIKKLNTDLNIYGIIVQLPLPKKINPNRAVATIRPEKDVDGFHKKSLFVSPVHQAIIKLLKHSHVNLKNKKAIIVTKNQTFARPLIKILRSEGLRVTMKILKKPSARLKLKGQIIIVMLGWPNFIQPEMVEKKAIIIDAGYNLLKKRALGDVDRKCCTKASCLSPVPGGVGPLTVAFLLKNVCQNLFKK